MQSSILSTTHSSALATENTVRDRMQGYAARTLQLPMAMRTGAVLLCLAAFAVAFAIVQLRADALEDARSDMATLATLLGEQTTRAVHSIDVVLLDLQGLIAEKNANSAETLGNAVSGEQFHRRLREQLARVPHANVFAVFDLNGRVLNSSRTNPNLGVDISDREFFQHLQSHDDSNLFVSVPIANQTTFEWVILIARRVNSKEGKFLGVVLGGISIRHFEEIYAPIALPRGESFVLARRDGTVLVRHPDTKKRAGDVIPAAAPWHRVVADGGGFYNSPGYFDGISRMVAVRPLAGFPLVVNAAISQKAALATWQRQAIYMGAGSTIVFAYAAFLMRVTQRQFARLEESRQELTAILETMDQGLMMVDVQGALVHCNSQAQRLLDLPDSLVRSRPTFRSILRYQWETNRSGREDITYEEFMRKRLVVDRPHTQEVTRPDGRSIEVRSVPMPKGGFVRTYTDISVRRDAAAKVEYLAHHDDLTQLVNRVAFRERMLEAIAMSRTTRQSAALLYIDLDHFKQVNDTHGHDAGDHVLAEAAQRMRATVRAIDTVARLGGDEFAVILPFVEEPAAAGHLAKRLVSRLAEPYIIDDLPVSIGASIGIAIFPQDGVSVDGLVLHADKALYEAKNAGRNTFRFHTADPARHPASA
jgi:diguanylate cyclase (GGDEF)-like protein